MISEPIFFNINNCLMQSAVFDTNKKSKFQLNSYYTNTHSIKTPSLTNENSRYVFRLKLVIFKTILDILNSMYAEYVYFKYPIYLNNIFALKFCAFTPIQFLQSDDARGC